MTTTSDQERLSSKEQLIQYLRVSLELAEKSDGLAYIASVPLKQVIELLERAAVETFGEPVTRPPDGYAWRRHVPTGDGTYLDFQNSGTVNGSEPIESVPYWVGPAAPTEFPKRPSECRHDAAMLKCNECGIDFSRVSVMSAPETTPCNEVSEARDLLQRIREGFNSERDESNWNIDLDAWLKRNSSPEERP